MGFYKGGFKSPPYSMSIPEAPSCRVNPIYARLERSCPRDSKNVSYVDVGLIESYGWGGGWWWGSGVVDSVRT